MKRLTMGIILSVLTCLLASPLAFAEKLQLDLISAPFGTGSYVLSTALEEMSKKYSQDFQINASETPGLVFNCRKLNKEPELKTKTIMSYTEGINYLAVNGLKPFEKKYPSVMLLANYNLGSVWLASLNPQIQKAEDLIDKKIALGRAPQILWTIEPEMILEHGWGLKEKIKVDKVGTTPAARALLDGLVDAAIIGGYADPISGQLEASPQTIELLASGKKLYHVSWGKSAIQKVIDKGIPIAHLDLPAGTLEGQAKPLEVFCDPLAWVVFPEFPEEAAYKVTKLIIERVKEFKDYHALGKLMSLKSLAYGWDPKRIHPGALKAYTEAGLVD